MFGRTWGTHTSQVAQQTLESNLLFKVKHLDLKKKFIFLLNSDYLKKKKKSELPTLFSITHTMLICQSLKFK